MGGVLMDPVEQWKVEVLGVVVSESSAGSPLLQPLYRLVDCIRWLCSYLYHILHNHTVLLG